MLTDNRRLAALEHVVAELAAELPSAGLLNLVVGRQDLTGPVNLRITTSGPLLTFKRTGVDVYLNAAKPAVLIAAFFDAVNSDGTDDEDEDD